MAKSVRKLLIGIFAAMFMLAVGLFAASCGPKTVTLTFVQGNGNENETLDAIADEEIENWVNDPTRTHYTFLGWGLEEEGDDVAVAKGAKPEKAPDRDTTYYARWQENAKVTLTLTYGVDDGTTTQQIRNAYVGDPLTDYTSDVNPDVVGLTFDGWYDGAEKVDTVPATATLTARYKIGLTLNVYAQGKDGEYPEQPTAQTANPFYEDDVRIKDILDYDADHFEVDTERSDDFALSASGTHEFDIYIARLHAYIYFYVNDAGRTETALPASVLWEGTYTVPDGEELFGKNVDYRFAGWATEEGGEATLDQGDQITADDLDSSLYACWEHANVNQAGGDDKIFVSSTEENTVYLRREGLEEQRGTYNPETGAFSFEISEAFTLQGTLDAENKTFHYKKDAKTYYLYDTVTQSVDQEQFIEFASDGALNVVVKEGAFRKVVPVYEEEQIVDFEEIELEAGTYTAVPYFYDDDLGEYVFIVDEEEWAFTPGWAREEQATTPDLAYYDVFFARGIEAGYYSDLDEFGFLVGDMIVLSGYGVAYLILDGSSTQYALDYSLEEDPILGMIVVLDSYDVLGYEYSFLVYGPDGVMTDGMLHKSIAVYDATAAGAYTHETFDEVEYDYVIDYELTLTGYGNIALLTDKTKNEAAPSIVYYLVTDTYDLAYMVEEGYYYSVIAYSVSIVELYVVNEGTDLTYYRTIYTFSSYDSYYGEWDESFEWLGDDAVGMRYADFTLDNRSFGYIILNATEEGDMIWFDYEGYVNYGTYTVDETTKVYTYTDTYSNSLEFKFYEIGSQTTGYTYFAFNVDTHPLYGTYKGAAGDYLLIDFTGEAIYIDQYGAEHEGGYLDFSEDDDNLVYYFVCSDDDCSVQFDFTVNGDTFVLPEFETAAEEYFYYDASASAYSTKYKLSVKEDGTAEVSYKASGSEEFTVVVRGTVALADPLNGHYSFTVTKVADQELAQSLGVSQGFLYITAYADVTEGRVYLFLKSDGLEGSYEVDGMQLTLDGFGMGYLSNGSVTFSGVYEVMVDSTYYEDNHSIVVLTIGTVEYYFDFWTDGTVTARGGEGYKMYQLTDGTYLYNYYLLLDGNGHADIIYYYTDGNGYTLYYLAEVTSSYEMTGGGYGTAEIEYTTFVKDDYFSQEEADMLNALIAQLPSFGLDESFGFVLVTLGSYECFLVYDEQFDDLFVMTDGSVLVTNGYFEATFVDCYGEAYTGQYTVEIYTDDDEPLYTAVRFSGDYNDDFTLVKDAEGVWRNVGNEFGLYEYGSTLLLFLDGMGGAQLITAQGAAEGTYIYDGNLQRVEATFAGDGVGDVTYGFELDLTYMTFTIKDDDLAGEFHNASEQNDKLYGNGFGAFLRVDENGERTYLEVFDYDGDLYTLVDGYGDEIVVRLDLEERTFSLSDPSLVVTVTTMWDILTGKTEQKTVSVDGFGVVTIDGIPSGTLTGIDQKESTASYTVYTTTESKFATFLLNGNGVNYATVWAPYNETYAVTLTEAEGTKTIVLDGMAAAKFPGDTYLRNMFYVQGNELTTDNFYHSDNDVKHFTVDWEKKTYTEGGVVEDDDFVIENGVLTAYKGTATVIKIPDGVTEIGEGVFKESKPGKITSVDLNGVTKIGKDAFRIIESNIPSEVNFTVTGLENVTEIGETAFRGRGLAKLTLTSIVTIGEKAFFADKTISEITIGENCKTIGDGAFTGCGLASNMVVYHFLGTNIPTLGSATALGVANGITAIYFKHESALTLAKEQWTTYTAKCQLEQA